LFDQAYRINRISTTCADILSIRGEKQFFPRKSNLLSLPSTKAPLYGRGVACGGIELGQIGR